MRLEHILQAYAQEQGWNDKSKVTLCLKFLETLVPLTDLTRESMETKLDRFLELVQEEENAMEDEEEQQRRDEKNGLYPDKADDCN